MATKIEWRALPFELGSGLRSEARVGDCRLLVEKCVGKYHFDVYNKKNKRIYNSSEHSLQGWSSPGEAQNEAIDYMRREAEVSEPILYLR